MCIIIKNCVATNIHSNTSIILTFPSKDTRIDINEGYRVVKYVNSDAFVPIYSTYGEPVPHAGTVMKDLQCHC